MAKNINMTRERKIALPLILEAAKLYYERLSEPLDKQGHNLGRALEAFREDK